MAVNRITRLHSGLLWVTVASFLITTIDSQLTTDVPPTSANTASPATANTETTAPTGVVPPTTNAGMSTVDATMSPNIADTNSSNTATVSMMNSTATPMHNNNDNDTDMSYTVIVTEVVSDDSLELNSTIDDTMSNTTMMPDGKTDNIRPSHRTSIPVALYISIAVILALSLVLLLGLVAQACATRQSRPQSYDINNRANGHPNPAFDSGEVADDDENNPVKGIMREARVDIESGMYNDHERTPL